MKHILIVTRDEVIVEIVKPLRPLYGARYDHILIDANPATKDVPSNRRFWDWITGTVYCRVKDSWDQVHFFDTRT